eukprot:CAMPEP_0172407314 /NCGR_PEP_ID=MMETSP1061-20121228/74088_1 /TAXON_ID=37318 /ORGANISM="Pseudo-nitzschia pungens, Strain cf. pungens" /LENGTH=67 /DNA_ID=CAMNT_0013143287 /DNA_START=274 /DNA_END=474 /DNA_ORIENTATION=-
MLCTIIGLALDTSIRQSLCSASRTPSVPLKDPIQTSPAGCKKSILFDNADDRCGNVVSVALLDFGGD